MPSPIVAATVQAAALSTASNFFAQFIEAYQENRPFALDFAQLLRFIVLTLLTAPPNFHWQQFLERSFPGYPGGGGGSSVPSGDERGKDDIEMRAGSADPDLTGESSTVGVQALPTAQAEFSWKNTWTKWFVDCITMGAIMNTVAFLIIMGLLKGQAGSQILYNIRTETIPIIVAGYKIWPIASIVSFTWIPVHRRIVFLSFVGLIWGIYMSLVANRV